MLVLKQIADVAFPTHWAAFRLLAFEGARVNNTVETALALILGDIHSTAPVVRIHSQCTTGEAFHSLLCDCNDQLHLALRVIAAEGAGVLSMNFRRDAVSGCWKSCAPINARSRSGYSRSESSAGTCGRPA